MLSRVAFYPTLLYNVAMEKLSSRTWYTRIDDTILLGALPFRSMTEQLVSEENVKGVITMNEEFEVKHFVNSTEEWQAAGVEHLWLPTPDLIAAPSQQQLNLGVMFCERFRESGGSVYVHCKAGRTRSATIVACSLIQQHKWTPEEAVAFITGKRPHVSIRKPQWEAIRTFHANNIVNTRRQSW